MEWKKDINANLGITIILVFAALFTIIDFYIVGAHMDGYPFNELSGTVVNNVDNNTSFQDGEKVFDVSENEENSKIENVSICHKSNVCDNLVTALLRNDIVLDSDSNVRMVTSRTSLARYSMYADIQVVDGKLLFTIHKFKIDEGEDTANIVVDEDFSESITYGIPNEHIKYIFVLYYQPGGNSVIYALTDNNNLYMSEYSHFIAESEYKFESVTNFKLINSDVVDMRLLDNPIPGEYTGGDGLTKSLYAVKENEMVKLF